MGLMNRIMAQTGQAGTQGLLGKALELRQSVASPSERPGIADQTTLFLSEDEKKKPLIPFSRKAA